MQSDVCVADDILRLTGGLATGRRRVYEKLARRSGRKKLRRTGDRRIPNISQIITPTM